MRDFTETKLFGSGLVGLAALGTCYLAGLDSVSLIALSLLALLAYHLLFQERRLA
jgi:hypothetical protein